MMAASAAHAQQLNAFRPYAELGLYYLVTRGDGEISRGELRSIMLVARDLLLDTPHTPAADREIELAHSDARDKATARSKDHGCQENCPWDVTGLRFAIETLLRELGGRSSTESTLKAKPRATSLRPGRRTPSARRASRRRHQRAR